MSQRFVNITLLSGIHSSRTITNDTSISPSIIGRLLMPRLEIARFESEPEYRDTVMRWACDGLVCGFCVFKGSIESTRTVLAALQSHVANVGRQPLTFSCDAEWGLPMRLSGEATEFPHALALAHSKRPNAIRDAGRAIGAEMRAVGLHWNFAPVADVIPIRRIRSSISERSANGRRM
jgi:beta-N-acetylhexosaminidase